MATTAGGRSDHQSACPSCGEVHARPTFVAFKQRIKTVGYRCDRCRHEWEERSEAGDGWGRDRA